ncbi:MAG: glutamyl-tRNA reductase [bacterium]|nr:glutamyl-tRNA reductase [bacterium]
MELGIIGTSVWQQNMALLETLTLDRETRDEQLRQIKKALGLDELIYLATCNRVEFLYVSSGKYTGDRLLHRLVDYFFKNSSQLSFFPNDFYHYPRKEAVRHLFRTVSSLESLVIGETQISRQFREAYESALDTGLLGPQLKRLAEEALAVSRKVKRETNLVNGSLSMAALACRELRQQLGTDRSQKVALIGAGEMTVKMAKYIGEANLASILFVNRTLDKAADLAERFNGTAVSLDDFINDPGDVSAIVSATAARTSVFDADFLARLETSETPVICVDLAVPRDFSTDFVDHPEIVMVDIPYLKAKGNGNLRQRFVEAGKASQIVSEAVNNFLSSQLEVSLKPIFHDSFKESLALTERALHDLFSKRVTSLDSDEKEAVVRLVNKLIAHSSFQPARIISDRLAQMEGGLNLDDLTTPRKEAV